MLIVPSGVHAMHRHVTKDACNMQWTDSLRFSRAMPAIVPSPDGIYIAPFIEVALRHTMREYDPRITVAKIDEDVFRKTELAAYSSSTRYDRVNRDYGNEVILPDAERAYRVYNVAGSRKPPSCMTKPMKIHTRVERNVEYESRPLFNDFTAADGSVASKFSEKTGKPGLLLRARDISKRKVDISEDSSQIPSQSRKGAIKRDIASTFQQMTSDTIEAIGQIVTKPIRAVMSQPPSPSPPRITSTTYDEYADDVLSGTSDAITGIEAVLMAATKSPNDTIVQCSAAAGGCAAMEIEE